MYIFYLTCPVLLLSFLPPLCDSFVVRGQQSSSILLLASDVCCACIPSFQVASFFRSRTTTSNCKQTCVARVAPHACKPGIACPRVEPTTAKPHRFVVRALANRRGTRHCLRSTEYIFYCPCFEKQHISCSLRHAAIAPRRSTLVLLAFTTLNHLPLLRR